jgi:hypothetical protein
MGGFVIYKVIYNQKPVENNGKPSQISPPQTDLPSPSKEQELEKYLLEKRLDLKKYFVFNLGELKTMKESSAGYKNWR